MPIKFSMVTIFPEMVSAYLGCSILKRAIEKGAISVNLHNLRDYVTDKHKMVDDYSYGGGPGMVMKPEPFFRITEKLWPERAHRRIVMLSPRGRIFDQETAKTFSEENREIVFLCGRYEAIDERVSEYLADDEISIGDYILTGGELPALVIIDAVARLVPDVLGDFSSTIDESFTCGLLDYPHYTRPEIFMDMPVPKVLLSGNHSDIKRWRRKQSFLLTIKNRPELLDKFNLSKEDKILIDEIKEDAS